MTGHSGKMTINTCEMTKEYKHGDTFVRSGFVSF